MSRRKDQHQDFYANHGGVHFTQNVPAEQINNFVRELSSEKRDNLFEVLDELEQAGMITLYNDGQLADGSGHIGGTAGCYEENDR
ncbi:hypothetical protein [Tumebacillus permanentifrigoris]|uniref:Uncharacterized protein n=1 Tax=Tumebacillus permanentifrigoris TaxID=378543 RepID=A0A316DGL5_9BACL|nr:hypothetical protein [Tumebacillus permanentifrigoris]PWK16379.1 hypothetical protein C7459_101243 [Tumebacillus permanentifrigoris]